MALITLNFCSVQLKMNTSVSLIIPDSTRIGEKPLSKRKVLTLLHGLSGDNTSFVRFSNLETYIEKAGLVVVMPSGGRSGYCDDVLDQNYFTFISQELPEYLHKVFGLSSEKEDNHIGGISMGGMGALKIALTYPERYEGVASFSGLTDLGMFITYAPSELKQAFSFMTEQADAPAQSHFNPLMLLNEEARELKYIYLACGLSDEFILMNKQFAQKGEALNLSMETRFEPGQHDWFFWDNQLKQYIDYYFGKNL